MTTTRRFGPDRLPDRFTPRRSTLGYGALLVNTELLVVFWYLLVTEARVSSWLAVVYPLAWINVGLWALVRANPSPRSRRHALAAGAVAAAYLLLLFVVVGLIGPSHDYANLVSVSMLVPGVGPLITYNGPFLRFTFVPFLVVGYLGLAYLVYATLLDAAGSAITGVLGFFSCLSCLWPLLVPIVAGVAGSGAAAAAMELQSYGVGTAVFVATVALLYWRPFKRGG